MSQAVWSRWTFTRALRPQGTLSLRGQGRPGSEWGRGFRPVTLMPVVGLRAASPEKPREDEKLSRHHTGG